MKQHLDNLDKYTTTCMLNFILSCFIFSVTFKYIWNNLVAAPQYVSYCVSNTFATTKDKNVLK